MKKLRKILCAVVTVSLVGGATIFGGVSVQAKSESGKVSWYDQAGSKNTASGKKAKTSAGLFNGTITW